MVFNPHQLYPAIDHGAICIKNEDIQPSIWNSNPFRIDAFFEKEIRFFLNRKFYSRIKLDLAGDSG